MGYKIAPNQVISCLDLIKLSTLLESNSKPTGLKFISYTQVRDECMFGASPTGISQMGKTFSYNQNKNSPFIPNTNTNPRW